MTRSLALPFVVSFLTASFCLALAMLWKMYDLRFPFRKVGPLLAMGVAMVFVIVGVAVVQPNLAERWYQRMFDNRGEGGATTEDLSSLMRKAEAKSMWDILSEQPHSFIYGRGLGAAYYWDEDYFPELFLVYPEDRHQFPDEIFSAGHSIWTYTLFSTGFIGIAITLLSFFIPMGLSLHAAWLNSTHRHGTSRLGLLSCLPALRRDVGDAQRKRHAESLRRAFHRGALRLHDGPAAVLLQPGLLPPLPRNPRQTSPQIVLDEETAASLHDFDPPARPLFQGRGTAGPSRPPEEGTTSSPAVTNSNPPPGRAPAEP